MPSPDESLDQLVLINALLQPDRYPHPVTTVEYLQTHISHILLAGECDARGRLGLQDTPYPQGRRLAQALQTALGVATNAIAESAMTAGARGPKIGELIQAARAAAIAATP